MFCIENHSTVSMYYQQNEKSTEITQETLLLCISKMTVYDGFWLLGFVCIALYL